MVWRILLTFLLIVCNTHSKLYVIISFYSLKKNEEDDIFAIYFRRNKYSIISPLKLIAIP